MPRVLIADDEDSMRTLVARAIAMDGHDTVTAEDGAEALEILTRERGAFDLLLTDIQMPLRPSANAPRASTPSCMTSSPSRFQWPISAPPWPMRWPRRRKLSGRG